MADRRLPLLNRLEQSMPARPPGRIVVLGARLTATGPIPIGPRDLTPLEAGSPIQVAGRVAVAQRPPQPTIEVMAWNTGESRDLKRFGTLTHAERQLYECVKEIAPDSVEIELSHSPCTGCADILAGWLSGLNAASPVAQAPRIETLNGRRVVRPALRTGLRARLAWAKLYDSPPQATNWAALNALHDAGWSLAAPRDALPPGEGRAPVTLL